MNGPLAKTSTSTWTSRRRAAARRGQAALDYFLGLAIVLPLAGFLFFAVPRIVRAVYQFTVIQLSSPLM